MVAIFGKGSLSTEGTQEKAGYVSLGKEISLGEGVRKKGKQIFAVTRQTEVPRERSTQEGSVKWA